MYICHEPTTEIVPWRQILAAVLVIVAGICIAPMFPGQQNVAASSGELTLTENCRFHKVISYLQIHWTRMWIQTFTTMLTT